jgi:threonine synthase
MTPLTCRGCGAVALADSPAPYRCPNAAHDAGDHIIGRDLDASDGPFPTAGEANPFLRYRRLTYAYALATRHGMTDDAFVQIVTALDDAVKRVSGRGFIATPFRQVPALATGVWVKDETGNVSGSHKARHLMGLAILGEVTARLGLDDGGNAARLAIASCGNAALAAAVIARAWDRPLDVFIPPDASPRVIEGLASLGATVHVCARSDGAPPGDPCYHAFVRAVRGGAVPFCCQGSENGLTIEGGETLMWEVISELALRREALDQVFVQVGGGALASACVQALRDAKALGVLSRVPRIHAVQTRGAYPLQRAWHRIASQIAARLGIDPANGFREMASGIAKHADKRAAEDELDYAAKHRSEFMWPWETEPVSVAHGILDDETYDWLAIVRGMIDTGGFPLVVDEERLVAANRAARAATGIDVDETGSSGLAGLTFLESLLGGVGAPDESSLVIFSGVRR